MSFLDQVKNYHTVKPPEKNTWRDRFKTIQDWASANAWDDIPRPDDKELKLCIETLFEAVNDAICGLRWIDEKQDLNAAKSLANILEGR